MKVLYIYRRL